jgi:glycerol-3-phosphate dehydrogenase
MQGDKRMQRDLAAMSRTPFDLLVIGGGITGACIAWDATLRGLKVALVDKSDFGSATTAATSKLIHGGLRYLKNREFSLVRESLRERKILSRIAPHCVFPIPFLVPAYARGLSRRRLLKAAMVFYDFLSLDKSLGLPPDKRIPCHRFLSPQEALREEPCLDPNGLEGAYVYYDCQDFNPERFCLEFIRSAVGRGAAAANYAEVVDLVRRNGRIEGARVRDKIAGKEVLIRAQLTVNGTGPWADHVLGLCKGVHERKVRRSKGIHVLTRPLTRRHALALFTPAGRHLFILPWRGMSLLGTTDTEYVGDPDHVGVDRQDIDSFLATVNEVLPSARLTYGDVRFCYAGLRPIVEQDVESVYEASRKYEVVDHEEEDGLQGFLTVIGGKYTTSRSLAEQVVTRALRKIGRGSVPCTTHKTRIHGGEIDSWPEAVREAVEHDPFGLGPRVCEHLVQTYGSAYRELYPFLESIPEARKPLCEGAPDLAAELWHAVKNEMCVSLSDFLLRRTGIGTLGDPGRACVDTCARKLSELLNWTPKKTQEEIDDFLRKVRLP